MDENTVPAERQRPLTKKELKALHRLEKLDQKRQEKSQSAIKWIAIGIGTLIFVTFFGSLIFLTKQTSQKPIALSDIGWTRGAAQPPAQKASGLGGKGSALEGADRARVTLTEFADFQCPACKTYHPIILGILSSYKDKSFRLMYKHFPLTSAHKNALPSAMAAEAAGVQGKFFEMHDILYEKQDEWAQLPAVEAQEKFISYAKELVLDLEKFLKDLANKELEAKIRANQDEGINNGVSGTPTFFLNGKIIQNPRSIDDFKKLIEEELK